MMGFLLLTPFLQFTGSNTMDEYDLPMSTVQRTPKFDNLAFMPDGTSIHSRSHTPTGMFVTRGSGSISSIEGHVKYADLCQSPVQGTALSHIRQRSNHETSTNMLEMFDRPSSSLSAPAADPLFLKSSPGQRRTKGSDLRGNYRQKFTYSPKSASSAPSTFQRQQNAYRPYTGSLPRFDYPNSQKDESHYTLPNDGSFVQISSIKRRHGVSDDHDEADTPSNCVPENYLTPNSQLKEQRQSPVLYNPDSKITYLTSKDLESIDSEEEDAEESASGSVVRVSSDSEKDVGNSSAEKSSAGFLPSPKSADSTISPSDKEVMTINFPKDKMAKLDNKTDISNLQQQKRPPEPVRNNSNNQKHRQNNSSGSVQSEVPDIIKHGRDYEEDQVFII